MKPRTKLILGSIAMLPLLLSSSLNMMIGVMYWSGDPNIQLQFYAGQCNNELVAVVNVIGLFSMAFVFASQLEASRHSKNINNLEQAIDAYRDAKKEMETARDKYTEMLKK